MIFVDVTQLTLLLLICDNCDTKLLDKGYPFDLR